jgi:hypothetical protein
VVGARSFFVSYISFSSALEGRQPPLVEKGLDRYSGQ